MMYLTVTNAIGITLMLTTLLLLLNVLSAENVFDTDAASLILDNLAHLLHPLSYTVYVMGFLQMLMIMLYFVLVFATVVNNRARAHRVHSHFASILYLLISPLFAAAQHLPPQVDLLKIVVDMNLIATNVTI